MKASRLPTGLLIAAAAASLPFGAAVAQSPPSDPATQPAQPSQGSASTFESLDTNHDGKISKTEAAANANVLEQFSRYDKDGNGFIERAEVTRTNTSPPENSSPQ